MKDIEIRIDGPTGNGMKVLIDGKDISELVRGLSLHTSLDGINVVQLDLVGNVRLKGKFPAMLKLRLALVQLLLPRTKA